MKIYRKHIEESGNYQKLLNDIIGHINNVKAQMPHAPVVFVLMNTDDWYFLRDWLISQPGYGNINETKHIVGNPIIVSNDIPEDNVYCTPYPYKP